MPPTGGVCAAARSGVAPAIADLAAGHGIAGHELTPRHASLEEAYLDITSDSVQYRAGGPAEGKVG